MNNKANIAHSRKLSSSPHFKIETKNIFPYKKNKNIISYEKILKEVFDNIEMFEKNFQVQSKISDKYKHLLGIFDGIKLKESICDFVSEKINNYDRIWRNFFELTIHYIENLENEKLSIKEKYNDQVDKLTTFHTVYENEKNKSFNQECHFKSEQKKFNKILHDKEKQIAEMEKTFKEYNKKLAIKEECDTNEIYLYNQKQLLRDNKLLSTENKQLRDSVSKLEKEIENLKIKEVKIMKILFSLSRKGIAINDIVENELSSELKFNVKFKGDSSSQEIEKDKDETISINDSMYTPLYIDSEKKNVIKPGIVPSLNLYNINNSFMNFASDETTKIEKILSSNMKAKSYRMI